MVQVSPLSVVHVEWTVNHARSMVQLLLCSFLYKHRKSYPLSDLDCPACTLIDDSSSCTGDNGAYSFDCRSRGTKVRLRQNSLSSVYEHPTLSSCPCAPFLQIISQYFVSTILAHDFSKLVLRWMSPFVLDVLARV